jgi:hypothetical protein
MIFWIVVTTVYGFIQYYRGQGKGARDLIDMMEEAKIITKIDLYNKLQKHYSRSDEEQG